MRGGAPEMLPPDPDPRDPGLPAWVLPVSLLGLAILLISTIPALVARRRLERTEARLVEDLRALEERTRRTDRDRRAIDADEYVIDRAMRELLEPGPRVAQPRVKTGP